MVKRVRLLRNITPSLFLNMQLSRFVGVHKPIKQRSCGNRKNFTGLLKRYYACYTSNAM